MSVVVVDSTRNFFLSDAALSQQQLKRLSEHKYNVQNNSCLEPYVQPFWNWFVGSLPLWIAPNLITVTGLLLNFISVLIMLYYESEGNREVPRWTFFLSAVTIFCYQTLDGIDGKQARRTKTASPLGELFDHGCDAFSQVLIGLQIGMAMHFELYPNLFLVVCLVGEILFYCAHWQAYVSGRLTFNKFDCFESLCCVMIVCFISGSLGPEIWTTELCKGMPLNFLIVMISVLPASLALYRYFEAIFSEGAGKNGSSVAGTGILSPLSPLILIIVPQIMIYNHRTPSTTFSDLITFYCFTFGFVSAKITIKLVVAHLTKSPMTVWDTSFYGPLFIFLNQYYDEIIPDYWTLIICSTYCGANLILFCYETTRQICSYLHVECFRIPFPPPE